MTRSMSNTTITSPLYVVLPRKTKAPRKVILNLNSWLHWQPFYYNEIKKRYTESLSDVLQGEVFDTPIALTFTLHRRDARKGDRANVLAIHEKMFCDALVHYGCIKDDNDEYIVKTVYRTGEIDRKAPRVDIEIIENN